MKKIKIAYLIPTLELGGAEKQQINILNGLDTSKYEVKLYVLRNKIKLISQISNQDIMVKIIKMDSPINFVAFILFLKDLKKFNPNIIHSHMYNANILARFLKIIFPNVKIINHYHGMSQWISKPKLWLEKATKKLVDVYIVVSKKSYKLRLSREGFDSNQTILLPNSVAIDLISDDLVTKQNQKVIVIGMASRLIPLKNIEGAINMVAFLHKKGMKVLLYIAGEGPHKSKLKSYVHQKALDDYIKFLGYKENMPLFYQNVDVYCLSSITEDLPLSLIEAMSMGKPIIASKVGGIPELVENLSCALLVENFFDEKELEKIYEFLKYLKLDFCKKQLSNYAIEHFGNEKYCKKLEKIYKTLIDPTLRTQKSIKPILCNRNPSTSPEGS